MRLLMLGGTGFVGRAVVAEALALGWEVTALHRGRHADTPGVRSLRGDRTSPDGLTALAGGEWDLAVDTWSAAPTAVRDATRLLADRVGHFVYVSSRSVYAFPRPEGAVGRAERSPVVEAGPDDLATTYPRDKRGAEIAVERAFGDRGLLARAGLILGPHEDIGRLPWWLERTRRGGDVLAPGPPDLPLQYIDARDLAAWLLYAARRGLGGAYDVVAEPGHATMESLLRACVRATGGGARLRWADPEVIEAAGVEPWSELPVWLPPGDLHTMMHGADVAKALAAGLRCRPVEETVADTWEWLRQVGAAPQRPDRPRVGLAPEREAAVLRTL
ncbi:MULTISPECIES: NAD-dependent epimerase/dehydratase family protein [unclassified Streptomyces]|uniref:NAD-dependent epimerase/dehydratase family protein n=1 Tax=unclassified Streptomyces TaxID=2593676 RepID=UPI000CD4F9C5|nr:MULTISPECIES: NAD-dependent epimerase/dehydratase family protein [unclassified Streptomyces]